MGQTTTYDLPFPEPTDAPDGAAQIEELAVAVEAALAQLQTQLTTVSPGKPDPGDMKVVGYPVSAGSEPAGWLLCDGRAVSRATYAALFAKLSEAHGPGDGSTTFNLPDQRGRALVGAGTGPGLTARALGAKGGEESHTISVGELPSHNHGGATSAGTTGGGVTGGGSTGVDSPDHSHSGATDYRDLNHQHWLGYNYITNGAAGTPQPGNRVTGIVDYPSVPVTSAITNPPTNLAMNHNHGVSVGGASARHAHSVPSLSIPGLSIPALTIAAQGGGQGMNVVQPFVAVNVLIKT